MLGQRGPFGSQHNINKQCAFIQIGYALAMTSHGYILGVHMNECTMLNNIMKL